MAELKYDKTGRLLFTKEMKEEYTLLIPQMLPDHFAMLVSIIRGEGYKVEMLENTGRPVIDAGQKYVHNDACYPAILVIGQLINAVQSGKYDPHKVALVITQTGGGCRASNYIHLLRKALEKAGLAFVPVISVNLSGLESNPGFKLSLGLLRKVVYAIIYGDLIMNVANQVRPYEVTRGDTDAAVQRCMDFLLQDMDRGKGMSFKSMKANFDRITAEFKTIPVTGEEKVRVGVVGEIYVKYAPLGNNDLANFLLSEGAEPVIPGLMDFIIFKVNNREVDVGLYGGKWIKEKFCHWLQNYLMKYQHAMIDALKRGGFRAPGDFNELHSYIKGYLGEGNKMGEGWLLTAEMLELIHTGVPNIVCTQPFGCLPNHIVGKGMIRKIKDDYPWSNVVAIDYDPGATRINQENRIKLMLANARALAKEQRSHEEKEGEADAAVSLS
ncbi:2-hydroxyacyl-CoA dehydratase [Vermiculatibacterium agrestimuris]|uniref:2-hydroxyacyl-CoA dehydratase n=1 Tax=Vermiculatibacterium agrestimuris TaxID=2941519 RepID=UPI00203FEAB2|nr:2-hydroxyacyl-CoA dehydratase [Vermiculatibacterium agrestimuris]